MTKHSRLPLLPISFRGLSHPLLVVHPLLQRVQQLRERIRMHIIGSYMQLGLGPALQEQQQFLRMIRAVVGLMRNKLFLETIDLNNSYSIYNKMMKL
jgi:hypothetical protein